MVFGSRRVSDGLWAKPFWLMVVCAMLGLPAAYGQKKDETPQQTNQKIQELAAQAQAHPVDTPIGSGDLLHIDVFDVPELSRDVRVSDTGEFSYPLVPGRITAAGKTPFQLETELERLLIENGLVSHPQVSVFVREQYSQPVSVVGAVSHTMVYQVVRPTTLLEVLAAAGGISDTAGDVVIVTRPNKPDVAKVEPASATVNSDPDEQKITVRIRDLLESGDSVYDIPILGGDTVTVPPAGIVYVLGFGVAQPGGYVLQSHGEPVTVLKALALAHGLTSFAKPNSAVIMRENPATGHRDSIPVHIEELEKNKTADIPLKTNDILYVPDSGGKKALAKGAQAALGIGTSVAIYHVAY